MIKKQKKSKTEIVNMNYERILKEKGIKKKDVAEILCLTPQTLAGHLHDSHKDISEELVANIAQALEVKKEELYTSEDDIAVQDYKNMKYRYYFQTKQGVLIFFGSLAFLFYCVVMYQSNVCSMFAILAMLLCIDAFGMLDPLPGRKPKVMDRVLKWIIRGMDVLCIFVIMVYPLVFR